MSWSKFLRDARAASPVIGVILMVGTTVILGASVYGWTSQYANVPQQGVRVLALASEGPIEDGLKGYIVAAVMPGLAYGDLNFTLDGRQLGQDTAVERCGAPAPGHYVACREGRTLARGEPVEAGDHVRFFAERGDRLRIVDAYAGFVVTTMTVD